MLRMMILTLLAVALLAAPTLAPRQAQAQDVQRIAAIVNDEVISSYDLVLRLNLVINSTQMEDSPETRHRLQAEVLESLVDEKLQLQEAKRLNIRVTKREMATAIGRIEEQNNLAPGGFDDFARASGVDRDSLLAQIRAQISWSKVLRRRLKPIAEDEVDEMLEQIEADIGKPEYLISEIFIPINSPEKAADSKEIAEGLVRQIRSGAPFSAAARQFSRGTTAADGGQVGWIKLGQMAAEIDREVQTLEVDATSEPIETLAGYYIIKLHQRRRFLSADPSQARVSLRQLLLTLPEGAGRTAIDKRRREAEEIAASVSDCGRIEAAAGARKGGEYLDFGTLPLSQLSSAIRKVVQALPVGRFSEPVATPAGVMLLMVCERREPEIKMPDRDSVVRELTRREIAKIARRHIRDLRRDALVEYR